MPYIPFLEICPAIAEKETRVISILQSNNEFNLPRGEYVFIELFCDEYDCRRVFLQVFKNQKIVATIAFGWEKLSFYKKEFKFFDEENIEEIKGPSLDAFQYQSDISDRVLKMFNQILFSDKDYIDRIKKHYNEFRTRLKT